MAVNVYKLVHVDALPNILRAGGLHCMSQLPSELQKVDLSHYDVQERRARTFVYCYPGGSLHDYVPFYFAPRSPMLYAIYKDNVSNYSGGQTPLLYLVSNVERIESARLDFAFSTGHPIMHLSQFHNDPADLNRLDWGTMRGRYWFDSEEYPDRRRRRQAEFLVHRFFPWSGVEFIAVRDGPMRNRVRDLMLREEGPESAKPIYVKPSWYF